MYLKVGWGGVGRHYIKLFIDRNDLHNISILKKNILLHLKLKLEIIINERLIIIKINRHYSWWKIFICMSINYINWSNVCCLTINIKLAWGLILLFLSVLTFFKMAWKILSKKKLTYSSSCWFIYFSSI